VGQHGGLSIHRTKCKSEQLGLLFPTVLQIKRHIFLSTVYIQTLMSIVDYFFIHETVTQCLHISQNHRLGADCRVCEREKYWFWEPHHVYMAVKLGLSWISSSNLYTRQCL